MMASDWQHGKIIRNEYAKHIEIANLLFSQEGDDSDDRILSHDSGAIDLTAIPAKKAKVWGYFHNPNMRLKSQHMLSGLVIYAALKDGVLIGSIMTDPCHVPSGWLKRLDSDHKIRITPFYEVIRMTTQEKPYDHLDPQDVVHEWRLLGLNCEIAPVDSITDKGEVITDPKRT